MLEGGGAADVEAKIQQAQRGDNRPRQPVAERRDPAHVDGGGDRAVRHRHRREPRRVDSQQREQVAAARVAAEHEPRRVAAVQFRLGVHVRDAARAVLHRLRHRHRPAQAIERDDDGRRRRRDAQRARHRHKWQHGAIHEQRRAEARQLREAHEAELVGAEPREQRRLKELYRRALNELRQRHVAAVALENKAIDIRKRQKRRKELKPQLTDLFSARRGVPPELIQNILTFVGYDLVQAEAPAYDLMRDDPREVDPSALKK